MSDPTLDPVSIKAATSQFLSVHLRRVVTEDDRLLSSGALNSLLAMQLVLFVEHQFQITIGTDDLDRHNFDSLEAITQLVLRKIQGRVE